MPSPDQTIGFTLPQKKPVGNFCSRRQPSSQSVRLKKCSMGTATKGSIQTFQWSGPTEPQQGGDGYDFGRYTGPEYFVHNDTLYEENNKGAVHVN